VHNGLSTKADRLLTKVQAMTHLCRYLSKSFNETEQNYKIYNRELLAIIRALTEWRHYLMGSSFPVTVRSDHKNLTYFCTAQKLNR